jgi:hypothetical protein
MGQEITMNDTQIIELQTPWIKLMGDSPPDTTHFAVWLAEHRPEIVRHGIVKAAQKNLNLGRQMDQDHRVRYASSCMNSAEIQQQPLAGEKQS